MDHLDLDRVAVHLEDARRRGRYQGTQDPMTYLQQKHCLVAVGDQQYPTLAGLLCFGRDPQALFPNAVVDLGHYGGPQAASNDVIHLEKGIGGTLFDQIERTEAYLWRNTRHGMTVGGSGARRIELHEYPQAVIRELTVNMLAHRDYTMAGAASRVLLLSNRVEWSSPGGLPPGVTETNLLSMRNARNPGLLTIFYDAGFVEGYGMGLVTVVSVLDSEGLEPPQFRDLVGGAFMVTVFGRPLTQRERGSYIELSDAQRRIVRVLNTRDDVSLSTIREALPDRSKRTLQDDITGLIDAGLVERHGQTKATRYRLRAELPIALDSDCRPIDAAHWVIGAICLHQLHQSISIAAPISPQSAPMPHCCLHQ